MQYISLLFFIGAVWAEEGDFITVYEDDNFGGQSETVPLDAGCSNIGMNDMTTSVNTHGHCAMLCQDANCEGRCIKLKPDCGWPECCPAHNNIGLEQCDFNDKASSAKAC